MVQRTSVLEDVAAGVLVSLVRARDADIEAHLERMRLYAQVLAIDLGRTGPYAEEIDDAFLERLLAACPLHDIGKMAIPDDVLLSPCRLSDEEFDIMKEHTIIGWEILSLLGEDSSHVGFFQTAAQVARHHHERFDGRGYPDGLSGEAIPLEARIVSVADVFDALTSERTYKTAMAPDEARKLILEGSGSQYDPAVVDAMERCYPILLDSCVGQARLDGTTPRRESRRAGLL